MVCFAFFLMVLTTYPKAFVLLLGSIKSLSSPCPFPMKAQLLMGLRVSLKWSSRAERNYLELEGPPHLPSVPIVLPPYFTGGKLSVNIRGIIRHIGQQPAKYHSSGSCLKNYPVCCRTDQQKEPQNDYHTFVCCNFY